MKTVCLQSCGYTEHILIELRAHLEYISGEYFYSTETFSPTVTKNPGQVLLFPWLEGRYLLEGHVTLMYHTM